MPQLFRRRRSRSRRANMCYVLRSQAGVEEILDHRVSLGSWGPALSRANGTHVQSSRCSNSVRALTIAPRPPPPLLRPPATRRVIPARGLAGPVPSAEPSVLREATSLAWGPLQTEAQCGLPVMERPAPSSSVPRSSPMGFCQSKALTVQGDQPSPATCTAQRPQCLPKLALQTALNRMETASAHAQSRVARTVTPSMAVRGCEYLTWGPSSPPPFVCLLLPALRGT